MDITPGEILNQAVASQEAGTLVEKIDNLQTQMLGLPQVKCEVFHRFAPGIYIREVSIPAGTMVIGHVHKHQHLNLLLKGKVVLLNEDGSTTTYTAPTMLVGNPGRKIAYVEEDMVWQNIYATTETDVEKLEDELLDKSPVWQEHLDMVRAKLLPAADDQNSYDRFLAEFGLTEEYVRMQSECTSNMMDLPHGSYKIKVGRSNIEGKGLFATADIKPGEVIAPARIGNGRTIAGRYTNHSANPNAQMVRRGHKDIDLVAIKEIEGCLGGHDGQEITIDYRQAYRLAMQIHMEN